MTPYPKSKKKVFIASSGECLDNGYIDIAVKILNEHGFEPYPWNLAFRDGEFILVRLIELVNEMDFAICFFNEDMTVKFREKKLTGTAWNVILEYGMFIQKLSKERVSILQIGESSIPTDLDGIVREVVKLGDDKSVRESIEVCITKIINKWKPIHSLNNDELGISKTISESRNELDLILEDMAVSVKKHLKTEPLVRNEKFIFNFYLNALDNVARKFHTTTYLSSAFWIIKTDDVTSANEAMLKRIKKSRSNNSSIKRIFLIRRDLETEIKILSKKIIDYKSRPDGKEKLTDLIRQIDILTSSCNDLTQKGCEIRYAYDEFDLYELLDGRIKKGDTEIAIYDDDRIDFYDGGKKGSITAVTIYSSRTKNFDQVKRNSEKYFDSLWKTGFDIKVLLGRYKETVEYYSSRVDFTIDKLLQFDNDINASDSILKKLEMQCVKGYLQKKDLTAVKSFLDLGTCTGRYAFELHQMLPDDCQVIGYDADDDCVKYAEIKKKILAASKVNVSNISFIHDDFLFPKNTRRNTQHGYHLITCMLGTISHFNRININPDRTHDGIQIAIERLNSLLLDNGILIISNWSRNERKPAFLSIYNADEKAIVEKGTMDTGELIQRLTLLGLTVTTREVGLNKELVILFCRKSASKLTSVF